MSTATGHKIDLDFFTNETVENIFNVIKVDQFCTVFHYCSLNYNLRFLGLMPMLSTMKLKDCSIETIKASYY
jgi:hypothetical protein